jgi:hypothetical protein
MGRSCQVTLLRRISDILYKVLSSDACHSSEVSMRAQVRHHLTCGECALPINMQISTVSIR